MKIVKNVLHPEDAEALRIKFQEAAYHKYGRQEEGLYIGKDDWHPGSEEDYSSLYWRAIEIEKAPYFKSAGQILLQHALKERGGAMLYAYRMTPGDHFRIHDDSGNGIGFVYYLSKDWKWDWGGLLMVRNGDSVTPFLPKFNQLVVIDYSVPHFVTPIAPYAKEPRYAVVGFIQP